jgi:hypothetical protein
MPEHSLDKWVQSKYIQMNTDECYILFLRLNNLYAEKAV